MIFLFQQLCEISYLIITCFLTIYDSFLLSATYKNRKDGVIPFAYLTIMSLTGITAKLSIGTSVVAGVLLSTENYQLYRTYFGKQVTMMLTFSYLVPLFLSFIMTLNRLSIVIKPSSAHLFTHSNIFKAGGILAILTAISLLVPYYSTCDVNFDAISISFKSGCAPDRHPITTFQNNYTILFPIIAMILNIGIIFHLKFVRMGTYSNIGHIFSRNKASKTENRWLSNKKTGPDEISKMQLRRERTMMKQSIATAIYLTMYELSALLMKLFPGFYISLPDELKLIVAYTRMIAAGAMNFSVYFIETQSTRKMVLVFMGLEKNKTVVSTIIEIKRCTK